MPNRKLNCFQKSQIKNPTRPEQKFYALLRSLGIKFVKQQKFGRYYVDAFLPEYNLICEMQGCFFHFCPLCVDITSAKAKLKRKYDKIRELQLRSAGYDYLNIWEHEIRDYPSFVKIKIKQKIKNAWSNLN